jgi:hypothetical protein
MHTQKRILGMKKKCIQVMRRTCGVGGKQLILHVDDVGNLWTLMYKFVKICATQLKLSNSQEFPKIKNASK